MTTENWARGANLERKLCTYAQRFQDRESRCHCQFHERHLRAALPRASPRHQPPKTTVTSCSSWSLLTLDYTPMHHDYSIWTARNAPISQRRSSWVLTRATIHVRAQDSQVGRAASLSQGHIRLRFFFVQEHKKRGEITINYTLGEDNPAGLCNPAHATAIGTSSSRQKLSNKWHD